jgi:AcrR family transcriptional regulator
MMPRPRREAVRKEIAEEIKTVARRQMSERGTAGLSLRSIARELKITAPAMYNYYPSLDDLITALITDAFTDLALSMENARENTPSGALVLKIEVMLFAYRQWAIEHAIDFQLIYGNPIPGYEAPFDLTGPLARRPFMGLFELYGQALKKGELTIPEEYAEVPQSISSYLKGWRATTGIEIPDTLVCLLMSGWARIHGLVMLELFHHLQPVIGDSGALYTYEIRAFHKHLGFQS